MLDKVTDFSVLRNTDEVAIEEETAFAVPPQIPAATVPLDPPHPIQPENAVGVALGGGAAKGWAHIGVLRALDEAGIAISMIAGTSIGALVGGCYLAGKLDELEEFARSLKRTKILRFLDFRFGRSGLISGDKLAARMSGHLGDVNIENLSRPFVAIATDIDNAHEIWLHDGPIIDAIRASYALPGVFDPVQHNGRRLVDGALVNPVPVSACRAMEAQAVIAVNLNSETFGRGSVVRSSHYAPRPVTGNSKYKGAEAATDIHDKGKSVKMQIARERLGISGVMMESFNIIQDRISRARLAGDPPDFTIRPRLRDIGLADFHRADESIRLGYEETLRRIDQLVEGGEILV